MSDDPLAGAYAPPIADLNTGQSDERPIATDALRLLGTMFVVGSIVEVLVTVVEMSRGISLTPIALAVSLARALVGIDLRRRGAAARWRALAMGIVGAVVPCLEAMDSIPTRVPGARLTIVATIAVDTLLRVAPALLLLLGRPGRARILVARVVFGLEMLEWVGGAALVLVRSVGD